MKRTADRPLCRIVFRNSPRWCVVHKDHQVSLEKSETYPSVATSLLNLEFPGISKLHFPRDHRLDLESSGLCFVCADSSVSGLFNQMIQRGQVRAFFRAKIAGAQTENSGEVRQFPFLTPEDRLRTGVLGHLDSPDGRLSARLAYAQPTYRPRGFVTAQTFKANVWHRFFQGQGVPADLRGVFQPSLRGTTLRGSPVSLAFRWQSPFLEYEYLSRGSPHQGRVLLAALGRPILGDPIYGKPTETQAHMENELFKLEFPDPFRENQHLVVELPSEEGQWEESG